MAANDAGLTGPAVTLYLRERLNATRQTSLDLTAHLSDADMTVQAMDDTSPAKWHLAHTTWFFEAFILRDHMGGYRPFDERFFYLFNSYYEAEGERHPRPYRGLITRPGADEVRAYRAHVDEALAAFMDRDEAEECAGLIELGINHEQQHQELLLTDMLYLFSRNPLRPAYADNAPGEQRVDGSHDGYSRFDGGIVQIGHRGGGFAYDNEGPRHEALLRPFRLADRLVSNGEWQAFMADGGYRTAHLWLADGWAAVNREEWQAPLYWENHDGQWWSMTLWGLQPVEAETPVCHISYYEADAFARWAGKRLPSEFEWEIAAGAQTPDKANILPSRQLRPLPAGHPAGGKKQMFGDVWEWTQSPYAPYPGFQPAMGAVGEYNGKFMINQMVLRGGSCVTPEGHLRHSYRNFFYPHQRWQFMGLRLAEDV